jgi:hypothetical protein
MSEEKIKRSLKNTDSDNLPIIPSHKKVRGPNPEKVKTICCNEVKNKSVAGVLDADPHILYIVNRYLNSTLETYLEKFYAELLINKVFISEENPTIIENCLNIPN